MLGRNATRPFGMSPSRLVAIYSTTASHRIAHWITKPFAMVHMQRYLSVTPQLLLTTPPNSTNGSIDLSASPSVAGVHTSAASLQQQQIQQQQQDPLSEKLSIASSASIPATAANSTNSATNSSPTASPTAIANNPTATPASSTTATASAAVPAPGSTVAFNYLLAASWHPKSRNTKRTAASLSANSPSSSSGSDDEDESKTKWWKQKLRAGKVDAGEDAFFHVSTPSRVALGVADGVGGWSEVGVDPALFSWALMDNAEAVARLTDVDHSDSKDDTNGQRSRKIPLDAQSILDGAYSELVQSGKVEAGSSTACILSLCKMTGTLRASNLGDSAYLLIRDNKCIYESPSQQHFWNCPYQLTVLPPGYPGAKQHVMDMPKDAAQTRHQLQDGDVIVLATDGFWDNVFTKEAIELVDKELGDIIKLPTANGVSDADIVGRVRALSQRLTNTARRFSLDQKKRTPFSQGARHIRSGGKIDDITVIVTLVRVLASQEHA
ncbi:phosphatase 2C-like domain-containing protein [Gamsiella multidivaricata]|uniref:phosphatase 2C-like domain-containing protein n=1 Tax=Gamsiella multidivaricata TaxID=101098 RepID=UPI00221FF532|nr:phosphatase 2C-like domain-containing protein [Gamsiella multidivaricata]KAG0358711.1 Protein phosphatase PTC7 [Gamsiella multidivaricata]KAI7815963.1 phosphatase 2C-like domain-containing protein [Gamsiella multidivaricata]